MWGLGFKGLSLGFKDLRFRGSELCFRRGPIAGLGFSVELRLQDSERSFWGLWV